MGPLSACDDRPEKQEQQQQVHKSMLSLVRHHFAVPKRLFGISYMTSDGRASSAQEEHKPSGRQSRNEYKYCCPNSNNPAVENTSSAQEYTCMQGDRAGTSIDRASNAQEKQLPSGQESRSEYRYHTAAAAVPRRE